MSTATRTTKSARELYSMAKRFGSWDPESIPVAEDRAHWETLNPEQREQLTKVCALFYEGEISVSDTLAWFLLAVPETDRRMFLTSQIYEEVKHAEFFELYFQEACGKVDTASYLNPLYRGVLLDELKQRGEDLGRALTNGNNGDLGLARALFATQYFGVIEGMMAVTGYDFERKNRSDSDGEALHICAQRSRAKQQHDQQKAEGRQQRNHCRKFCISFGNRRQRFSRSAPNRCQYSPSQQVCSEQQA
jgi:hypothetical protein